MKVIVGGELPLTAWVSAFAGNPAMRTMTVGDGAGLARIRPIGGQVNEVIGALWKVLCRPTRLASQGGQVRATRLTRWSGPIK